MTIIKALLNDGEYHGPTDKARINPNANPFNSDSVIIESL
jgi:hypothetical protein